MTEKASFSYAENLSVAFRSLKDRVKQHFRSERHARAEEATKRSEQQSAVCSKEAGTVAARVLRTRGAESESESPGVLAMSQESESDSSKLPRLRLRNILFESAI